MLEFIVEFKEWFIGLGVLVYILVPVIWLLTDARKNLRDDGSLNSYGDAVETDFRENWVFYFIWLFVLVVFLISLLFNGISLLSKSMGRKKNKSGNKFLLCLLLVLCCLSSFGCSANSLMKMRSPCPYAGSSFKWLDSTNMGSYCYKSCGSEKNGMIYTGRAGFIDMCHVYESIDRTKGAHKMISDNLKLGKTAFSFKMIEPATYYFTVEYPVGWNNVSYSEKQTIINVVSIDLGQVIAHRSTIWHESITYFNWSSMIAFSEKPSAFSWEDIYSDLLGTVVAAEALREGGNFIAACNRVLNAKIDELQLVSILQAKSAWERIKGLWWAGGPYPFINMKERNYDVGFDGFANPWLAPGMYFNDVPLPCAAPNLESTFKHGFKFKVEIAPGSGAGRDVAKKIGKKRVTLDSDLERAVRRIKMGY